MAGNRRIAILALSMALAFSFITGCGCGKKAEAEAEAVETDWTGGPQKDDADTPGTYEAYGYYAGGVFFDGDEAGADAILNATLVLSEDGTGTLTISGADIPLSWEEGNMWYRDMEDSMDPMYTYVSHKDEIIVVVAGDAYRYYMHKSGSESVSGIKFAQSK